MAGNELNDLVIRIRSELDARGFDRAAKTAKSLNNKFKDFGKLDTKVLQTALSNIEAPMKAAEKSTELFQKKLAGLKQMMMSIGFAFLFTGMMVNRYAMNMIKSTLKTFSTITYGAEGAGGALGVLSVHWELLKFAIGDALNTLLEAYMPAIIEVIVRIVDWISAHKELTAKILIFTAAISALAMVIGAGSLFAIGLTDILTKLGMMKGILGGFSTLGGVFNGLIAGVTALTGATGLGAILITLGLIAVALVVLYAAWKTNFANIKEFTGKTFESIKGLFVDIFGFGWRTFGNLFDIIMGIFEGDWPKVGKALIRVFADALMTIYKMFNNVMALNYNIVVLTINSIKSLFESVLKLPVALMKASMKVLGIDTSGIDAAEKLFDEHTAKSDVKYMSGKDLMALNEQNEMWTKTMDWLEELSTYGKDEIKTVQEQTKTEKEGTSILQRYIQMVTGEMIPSAQAMDVSTNNTTKSVQEMGENLGMSSNQVISFTNILTQAGIDVQKALASITNAILGGGAVSTAETTAKSYSSVKEAAEAVDTAYVARVLAEQGTGAAILAEQTRSLFRVTTPQQMSKHIGTYGTTMGWTDTGVGTKTTVINRGTTIQNQTNINDSSSSGGRFY